MANTGEEPSQPERSEDDPQRIRLIRPPTGSVPELGLIAPPIGGASSRRVVGLIYGSLAIIAALSVAADLILHSVLDPPGPWPTLSLFGIVALGSAGLIWQLARETRRMRSEMLARLKEDAGQ